MSARIQLTTKDFAILETMLDRAEHRPLMPLLRRKLAGATVVFRDSVDPDVVTLNSRVAFRIDDGPTETRIVVQGEPRGFVGMTLPITIPRGLAMLGLAAGSVAELARDDGSVEQLAVDDVLFQPEAAKWPVALRGTGEARAAATPFLRLVHSAEPPATVSPPHNDDDPDPFAA